MKTKCFKKMQGAVEADETFIGRGGSTSVRALPTWSP
jgi:hypothetical protein